MIEDAALDEVARTFCAVLAKIWTDPPVDRAVLELARLRAAELVGCEHERNVRLRLPGWGGIDEQLVDALSRYPSDPAFDPLSRAVLSLMEQIVIDVNGVTDDLTAHLRTELGDEGLTRLVMALVSLAESQRVMRLVGDEWVDMGPDIIRVRVTTSESHVDGGGA